MEVDEEFVRSVGRRGRGRLRRGIRQIWKWTVRVILQKRQIQKLIRVILQKRQILKWIQVIKQKTGNMEADGQGYSAKTLLMEVDSKAFQYPSTEYFATPMKLVTRVDPLHRSMESTTVYIVSFWCISCHVNNYSRGNKEWSNCWRLRSWSKSWDRCKDRREPLMRRLPLQRRGSSCATPKSWSSLEQHPE